MTKVHGLMLVAALGVGCGGSDPGILDAATDGGTDAEPSDGGVDAPGFYRTIPTTINRNLDVLFVVDNSGSMLAEQQQLAANFPELVNSLSQIAGGLPDLHLGVLSSNVGSAGAAGVPGCTAQGDDGNLLTGPPANTCAAQFGLQGNFIADLASPDGTRTRNYDGNLAGLFACMASLGTSGCGFEMHLESMYRALQPGRNPGFYRTDAHLAVIILADEDDCSTALGTMFGDPNAGLGSQLGPRTSFRCHEFGVRCDDDPNPRAFGTKAGCVPDPASPYMFEVGRYVDFLRNLKPSGPEVVVAGIAGTFDAVDREVTVAGSDSVGDPTWPVVQRSCFTRDLNDPEDGATPPVRLQAFLSAFPGHTSLTSICDDNLQDAVLEVGRTIKAAIGDPCIDAQLADVEPNLPGLQPRCDAAEVIDPDGPNRVATPLRPCQNAVQSGGTCEPGIAATPCWCLHPDVATCSPSSGNPLGLAFGVARGGVTPPLGTVVELYCRTE